MKQVVGKTYYYSDFISEEERVVIEEWVLRNEMCFIPNPSGPFRLMQFFDNIPEKLDLVQEIKKRIIDIENIEGEYFNPFMGDFASVHRNGGQVPQHIDHNPQDQTLYSRRYNVFITLPEKGGLPIYDGEVLDLPEKSLLRVDAGLIPHSTTIIQGNKPRIILSYGFAFKK